MSSYTPTTFNWHADFPDAFWYNVYFAKGVTSLASGDDGKQNSWIDGRVDMTQDPQNGYIMMSADTSTGRSFEVKFQAVRYTLTFNGNGHTGATIPASSSQIESEVISSIPTNGPTKTGHTFAGWYNATSGRRICLQEI
ncbi:InlB B-repeat-containing protein [Enterococcus termitis]